MSTKSIKLHFSGPLHIGSGREELDKSAIIYRSDALKSAIYATGLPFFPEWENRPDNFFNGFRISSCFPFLKNELFLPRPFGLIQFNFGKKDEDKTGKKAKKIAFLSTTVFRKWVKNPEKELFIEENSISSDGTFVFSDKDLAKPIYQSEIQQRVAISVEEGNSRPFYLDQVYFEPEAGLYFIIQCDNDSLLLQVLQALHLLGDLGIGTDRTVGNGLFSFDENKDIEDYELPVSNHLNRKINLGLYLPQIEEVKSIKLDKSSWQLVKRGGYIAGSSIESFRHLRKNNIFFFMEGSAFHTQSDLTGKYIDLKPDWNDETLHSVWRDGQPLFINV